MSDTPLLKVSHVTKRFANVVALDDVSFELHPGKILALLGENGAGKSTLVNILCGLLQPDKGEISIEGKTVKLSSAQDAYDLGITVIHQELNLARDLKVAENIFLGDKPTKKILGFLKVIDFKSMYEQSEKFLRVFGSGISPKDLISDLSPTEQQLMEILKGMRRQSRIFLMDEPTAGLDGAEVDTLLDFIRQLKTQGVTIIYVSHILEEVQRIADEIMVLRDGKKVDVVNASGVEVQEIIKMMVGHEVSGSAASRKGRSRGKQILAVDGISTQDGFVNNVSLELHEGEVLGLAGLTSSGRSELLRALYGVNKVVRGTILMNGRPEALGNTKQASNLGIGMIPRDRKEEGIFGIRNVRENITISSIKEVSGALGFTRSRQETAVAADVVQKLSIRTPGLSAVTGFLSGGNQQKVIFGRWLAARPKILLCDEPTRGIDIGAKAEIARIIKELAEQNISTIISSSELPELIDICDRILVMFEGQIVKEFTAETVVKEELARCLIGGS